jgi:hypothetical protein
MPGVVKESSCKRPNKLTTMNSAERERRNNDLRLQDLLGELQGFQLCENLSEYSAIEG